MWHLSHSLHSRRKKGEEREGEKSPLSPPPPRFSPLPFPPPFCACYAGYLSHKKTTMGKT